MRAKQIAPLLAAGALIAPASAQAHVSMHPNTIPAGAFATLDVRVPGEQQGAYVKKVDMLFPAGFTGVEYENAPGWSVKVIERKLATPIVEDGARIETEVAQILWTWTGPAGKVGDGQFIQFPLSMAIPQDASGKALEFRTVETYSDGHAMHWIDRSLSAEHPSPRINVTPNGGVIEDVAGEEAGPSAAQAGARAGAGRSTPPATAAKSTGGASEGLGILALALGALGLLAGLAGLAALAVSRRRSGG
jgi:uncharacterized protein YcnI